jgi:hypothetical protein
VSVGFEKAMTVPPGSACRAICFAGLSQAIHASYAFPKYVAKSMSPLLELVWQAWFRPRDEPSAAEAVVEPSITNGLFRIWKVSTLLIIKSSRPIRVV